MIFNGFEEIEFTSQAMFDAVSLHHPKSRSEILDYCCFHGLMQHFLGTSNVAMTFREAKIKQQQFEPCKKKTKTSKINYITLTGVFEGEKDVWIVFVLEPKKYLDPFEALISSSLYFSDKTIKETSIVLLGTTKNMDFFTFTQYEFHGSSRVDRMLLQRSLRYKLNVPIE